MALPGEAKCIIPYNMVSMSLELDGTINCNYFRDSNNKRTCYMHHGTIMPPVWDWINYANYFGRGFNVDTWVYKVSK